MNVLIDSHGWIEFFSNGPLASKYAKYAEAANVSDYITPSVILFEVYKRLYASRGQEAALLAIAHIVDHTRIIPIDKKGAIDAAKVSIATKLHMADAIIKAVAEENGAYVITGDPHFKGLSGVIFIDAFL